MMEFIGTTPEGWGFLCQKFMSGRCYTLLWMIQGGEGGKEKTEDWGSHLRSHPEVAGSETYSQEFRMHCRTVLDGKSEDVPLNTRLSIANALRYQDLHHIAGFFDFQLRRTACVAKLKRLCTPADYPSPPSFQTCSALSISVHTIPPFLNDPIYADDGSFMTPDCVAEEAEKRGVTVLKVDPPSVHCKQLYRQTSHPTEEQMKEVAKVALGNVSKVSQVEQWFANRRSLEFLKDEARLKRRCGQVTPGVLADVERLLRQLRGSMGINGQCTVSNLKKVLMQQGLCSSGPKPELIQSVQLYPPHPRATQLAHGGS
mmetsp:Transcript_65028/g.107978  ORF Transcript_65028/g.107978 Transcript_65028/m.107978 type:complete len:314 (+) Transcript_65028:246-1187(+)